MRLAVSVGTAAIGEMINERAGVLNLGLEGVMLLGGFAGFAASFESGSPWVGLISALAAGAVVGAAFAALVVLLRVDQVVAGLGLTLFGIAFTAFLNRELYGGGSSPPRTPRPDRRRDPGARPTSRSSARRCSPRTSSSTSPSALVVAVASCCGAATGASSSTPPARRPRPPTPPGTR